MVQPLVDAFGYHQNATQFPRKSANDKSLPSWSGAVNSGALVPSLNMGGDPSFDVYGESSWRPLAAKREGR